MKLGSNNSKSKTGKLVQIVHRIEASANRNVLLLRAFGEFASSSNQLKVILQPLSGRLY